MARRAEIEEFFFGERPEKRGRAAS